MSYRAYLGDYTIYGTEKADVTLARPVTIHNGLGFGEFPIPEDSALRVWTLTGQWTERDDYHLSGWAPANELLDGLKKIMQSDEPERLVLTDGTNHTSELAYVTDVTASEENAGVYNFTLKLTEYRKPTVRTTNVPTISRPGKIPQMPKTKVFNNAGDVAGDALERFKADANTKGINYSYQGDTGQLISTGNPIHVPTGVEVRLEEIKDEIPPGLIQSSAINNLQYDVEMEKYQETQKNGNQKSVAQAARDAIKAAYDKFKSENAKQNKKPLP